MILLFLSRASLPQKMALMTTQRIIHAYIPMRTSANVITDLRKVLQKCRIMFIISDIYYRIFPATSTFKYLFPKKAELTVEI